MPQQRSELCKQLDPQGNLQCTKAGCASTCEGRCRECSFGNREDAKDANQRPTLLEALREHTGSQNHSG